MPSFTSVIEEAIGNKIAADISGNGKLIKGYVEDLRKTSKFELMQDMNTFQEELLAKLDTELAKEVAKQNSFRIDHIKRQLAALRALV